MIVRNRMEELLRIQCAAEKEGEVSVGCLDNVRDLVDSLAAIKRVLIREPVLHAILQYDPGFESFCNSRQKGGIDNRCAGTMRLSCRRVTSAQCWRYRRTR